MTKLAQIRDFGRRIGHEFGARKVVLFGSYAKGRPSPDSDVDIFVILPFQGKSVHQSVRIRLQLRPAFPVDLIVRTPDQVRKRLKMGDPFIREVLEEGKVLYEADRR